METPNTPVTTPEPSKSPMFQDKTMKWSILGGGGLLLIGIFSYFLAGGDILKGQLTLNQSNTLIEKLKDYVTVNTSSSEFGTWPIESGKETSFLVSDKSPADVVFWSDKEAGNWKVMNADFSQHLSESTKILTISNNSSAKNTTIDLWEVTIVSSHGKKMPKKHGAGNPASIEIDTSSFEPETYTITLTVFDEKNRSDSQFKTLEITNKADAPADVPVDASSEPMFSTAKITADFGCRFIGTNAEDPESYNLLFADDSHISDAAVGIEEVSLVNTDQNIVNPLKIEKVIPSSLKEKQYAVKIANLDADVEYSATNDSKNISNKIKTQLSKKCDNLPAKEANVPAVKPVLTPNFTCEVQQPTLDSEYTLKFIDKSLLDSKALSTGLVSFVNDNMGVTSQVHIIDVAPLDLQKDNHQVLKVNINEPMTYTVSVDGQTESINTTIPEKCPGLVAEELKFDESYKVIPDSQLKIADDTKITTITPDYNCRVFGGTDDAYTLLFYDDSTSSAVDDSIGSVQLASMANNENIFGPMTPAALSTSTPALSFNILKTDVSKDFKYTASNVAGTATASRTDKLSEKCAGISKPTASANYLMASVFGADAMGADQPISLNNYNWAYAHAGSTVYFEATTCKDSVGSIHISPYDTAGADVAINDEISAADIENLILTHVAKASNATYGNKVDLDVNSVDESACAKKESKPKEEVKPEEEVKKEEVKTEEVKKEDAKKEAKKETKVEDTLKAICSVSPLSGTTDTEFTFTGKDSTGPIVAGRWEFGEGKASQQFLPDAESTKVAKHKYLAAGEYEAKLTIGDKDKNIDICKMAVKVSAVGDVKKEAPIENTETKKVKCSVDKNEGTTDTVFNFVGATASKAGRWDFGDSSSPVNYDPKKQTLEHKFSKAGTFTVTLFAINPADGIVEDKCTQTIKISTPVAKEEIKKNEDSSKSNLEDSNKVNGNTYITNNYVTNTTNTTNTPNTPTNGAVSRFEKAPEIKTGNVAEKSITSNEKFNCLQDILNPVKLIDTKDKTATLLTKLGTGDGTIRAIIEGYLNADGEREFKGANPATRAEVLKVLMVSSCTPFDITYGEKSVFDDVSEDNWAKDYINSAYELKIVTGFDDGTYRPNNNVTRIEAIAMLSRIAGIAKAPDSCEKQPFADIGLDHWGYKVAREAFCSNIVAGKVINGKRYLSPDELMNRNEMVTFIYNYYSSILESAK